MRLTEVKIFQKTFRRGGYFFETPGTDEFLVYRLIGTRQFELKFWRKIKGVIDDRACSVEGGMNK